MELFTEIVNGFQLLTNFAKHSILDFWQDSGYTSVQYIYLVSIH